MKDSKAFEKLEKNTDVSSCLTLLDEAEFDALPPSTAFDLVHCSLWKAKDNKGYEVVDKLLARTAVNGTVMFIKQVS